MEEAETLFYLVRLLCANTPEEEEEVREEILADTIPWHEVIALANRELLIPALYFALKGKEFFGMVQDEQLKAYLTAVSELNIERNEAILLQLRDVENICIRIGVAPLFLKGAAALSEGDYEHIGIRSMTDIDVLAPEERFVSAIEQFRAAGYRESKFGIDYDKHHHWHPMVKAGMPAALELHRRIAAESVIPCDPAIFTVSRNPDFKTAEILNPTYRLYHAFVHSEISHEAHLLRKLSIRHLYDFTVIADRYAEEIEWELLDKLAHTNRHRRIFYSYLYAAKQLFGLQCPLEVDKAYAKMHFKLVMNYFSQEKSLWKKYAYTLSIVPYFITYRRMQKIYGNHSRRMYPFIVIRHLLQSMTKRFLFSSLKLLGSDVTRRIST
jgi:hypothetical protein